MHDRPITRFDWIPILRYVVAFGGLAALGYFVYEIFLTKHLDRNFKFGSIAIIVAIGIAGAIAVLQRDVPEEPERDDRLYTAAEVAELLNAVRTAGSAHVDASSLGVARCTFCGRPGAEVRALDGTRYHRSCFQTAYREREAAHVRRR